MALRLEQVGEQGEQSRWRASMTAKEPLDRDRERTSVQRIPTGKKRQCGISQGVWQTGRYNPACAEPGPGFLIGRMASTINLLP